MFDLLRTGNVAVVKTLEYDSNFVAEIKRVSPKTLVVARLDLPQIELSTLTDPEAAAREFVDKLLPIATDPARLAAIDAWEAYNEPVPSDGEQMARLARFEAERTRLLASAPGSPTLRCGRSSARLLKPRSSTRATWAFTNTARRRCNMAHHKIRWAGAPIRGKPAG
jgi:hypothetical protein